MNGMHYAAGDARLSKLMCWKKKLISVRICTTSAKFWCCSYWPWLKHLHNGSSWYAMVSTNNSPGIHGNASVMLTSHHLLKTKLKTKYTAMSFPRCSRLFQHNSAKNGSEIVWGSRCWLGPWINQIWIQLNICVMCWSNPSDPSGISAFDPTALLQRTCRVHATIQHQLTYTRF